MSATTICLLAGWIFLATSLFFRHKDKDVEITIRLILSAFATGIFLANVVHHFLSR